MTQTIEMALPETEQQKFVELEQKIEIGFRTFVDVGGALLEIRDGRLYRAEYGTFEDYCRGRWGIERRRAYQLIDAAIVVQNITDDVKNFSHRESHVAPLARLEPQRQREAWGEAVATAPNGKPTAAHVEAVVHRFVTPTTQIGPERYKIPSPPKTKDTNPIPVAYRCECGELAKWIAPVSIRNAGHHEIHTAIYMCDPCNEDSLDPSFPAQIELSLTLTDLTALLASIRFGDAQVQLTIGAQEWLDLFEQAVDANVPKALLDLLCRGRLAASPAGREGHDKKIADSDRHPFGGEKR